MSNPTHGRFIWHDLMTTDKKAAVAFYTELFGWNTKDVDMGSGKYTMISAGGRDIGGIVDWDGKNGVPSHWLDYCTVGDLDAALKRVAQLGGKVPMPITDIPNVGRFAVAIDPQGAFLAPFAPASASPEPEGKPALGTFCWTELVTSDPAAALGFYKEIFGWTTEDMDMGPAGTYHILKRGDAQAGGLMKHPMPPAPSSWLSYVVVGDVDQATKRAESLKGKILVPPKDIPKIGRFSLVQDPTGALIAPFKGEG